MRWDWIARNLDLIGDRLAQHLVLTGIALGVGFIISLVLSLAIYRWRRLYPPITGLAGTLYTIPSLALFALLVPFTGLSLLTAEIALVSYTLLIFIRNIVAGLDGVPAEIREAADGMGYTSWQRLWQVEMPLALPVIVAGARVATVTTIGLVTVAAFVGQGGLGQLILDGLRRFFATPLYTGALLSLALALLADLALLGIQRALTPWSRTR
ncbi:MAG: ABC transporter permease [Chloroflexi bacterium]|nr:ABC transporter permease [Chloroflexota bacterium]